MDEKTSLLIRQTIDQQVSKVDRILDKRAESGQHFEDFFREEKARLYGMLQIFWLAGGEGYDKFRNTK